MLGCVSTTNLYKEKYMSTDRISNFNPGPAVLPLEVLLELKDSFMNFGGMSILEISHRGKEFQTILDDTRGLLTEIMGVPKGYHILFLQGGASTQFAMVPMNCMEKTADYAITGAWAKKAAAEAKLFGEVKTIYTSAETNFDRVPKKDEIKFNSGASYVHITTNNTIYGTQYQDIPDFGPVPMIADMSSDIMSKPVEMSKFAMIYAGAQKNLGPAGVTLAIIRDDLVRRKYREVPTMLKYSTHADEGSLFNTPPVFAIYVTMLVLKWIKKNGGLSGIKRINEEKAAILYDTLDKSKIFKAHAKPGSRSLMNVTFTLPDEEKTTKFLEGAKKLKMVGLKGHRSVGGMRASIYNAFPREGVVALTDYMKEFERTI